VTYVPTIAENACAAHGDCVEIAPEVFVLEDVAVVIGTAPDELILEAAKLCPSVAISVIDNQTGEQVFP
jgi:ferredoxin